MYLWTRTVHHLPLDVMFHFTTYGMALRIPT